MNFSRKALASAAAVAMLGSGLAVLSTGSASASTTFVATTSLTNRADGGHNTDNGGLWAVDTITRTATLVDNGPDSDNPGNDAYTLTLSDTGSFVTDAAASNPNGTNLSTLIAHQPITGSITGSGEFTFDVASTVNADSGSVPPNMSGNPVSSSDWPKLFFPGGTVIDYTGAIGDEGVYSYSYHSPQTCETWVDSSANGDGVGSADGGISGWGQCDVSVTNPGTQTTHVGSPASLQIMASTGSSDPALHYSMTGNPGGLIINSSTGLITGTPTAVENTDIVRVNVTDDYGSSAHVYFAWDVTNALVPDTLTLKYVCGFGHPRAHFLATLTGSFNARVNLQERLWNGQIVGDGSVTLAPGQHIITANNGVALRAFYEANGTQPPANNAGALFVFARIPAGHAHAC